MYVPIFGIDVWEHSYYLKYGPERKQYLKNFWDIVNWNQVSKNFEYAMEGKIDDIAVKY